MDKWSLPIIRVLRVDKIGSDPLYSAYIRTVLEIDGRPFGRLFCCAAAVSAFTSDTIMTNLRAVTSTLTLRIVHALRHGPLRFNAIERAARSLHPPQLSRHLKKLQRDGIVERRVVKLGPPAHVEYILSPLGTTLLSPATDLVGWMEEHGVHVEAAREYHRALAISA